MDSTSTAETTRNLGRWAWYSIAVNIVLVALNLLVATASGSLAVGTEVVHNGVDLLSAFGVLMGIKLATRKSRSFPYGLYKLENIVAVAVAALIFVTAYEIVRQAAFGGERQTVVHWWMFAVLAVAAAIPAIFGQLELRAGRAANSPALIADAKEYHIHVLTTGIALAALAGEYSRVPLDRLAAVMIVIPVAKTGWDLLFEGIRVLLDASLEPKTLETIRATVISDPMVVDVDSVTGRNAGRFRFVEITAVLRGNDLEKADCAAHRIERRIREQVPNIERVLIHVDPKPPGRLRWAVPLADREGTVADHFGAAPFFALATIRPGNGEVAPPQILPNPHREVGRAKGIRVAEWLVEQKTDVIVLGDVVEKGPRYVFEAAAVTIRTATGATTLAEALSEAADVE